MKSKSKNLSKQRKPRRSLKNLLLAPVLITGITTLSSCTWILGGPTKGYKNLEKHSTNSSASALYRETKGAEGLSTKVIYYISKGHILRYIDKTGIRQRTLEFKLPEEFYTYPEITTYRKEINQGELFMFVFTGEDKPPKIVCFNPAMNNGEGEFFIHSD
ncbi:hypothetical protein KAW38_04050 [Candidatus Micrarchaeota archaeon]|nr:hypothetical protein [Candidatus Micrarchaeota archaeon]